MSMPKKALVLYCPCEPNEPIPHVHQLTNKGCSGQIMLEATDDTTVAQLLGLDTHQIRSAFQERFHDLSLAILSNDQDTTCLAQQLTCLNQPFHSIHQVASLLSTDIDVLFVDFSHIENPWHLIDELLAVENNKDMIQCIISPCTFSNSLSNPIFPRQSYQMKNGTPVTVNEQFALIYSYFHSGSARIDAASEYTIENIETHGGNNKILAWHFLAEIGHKLGFVPKYGA